MAHTKAKGTTKLGRDSASQRLGVKIFGGSPIKCGQIIIRQRGTKYLPGEGVKRGNDDTLYAVKDGVVKFVETRYTNFTGNKQIKQVVKVITRDAVIPPIVKQDATAKPQEPITKNAKRITTTNKKATKDKK